MVTEETYPMFYMISAEMYPMFYFFFFSFKIWYFPLRHFSLLYHPGMRCYNTFLSIFLSIICLVISYGGQVKSKRKLPIFSSKRGRSSSREVPNIVIWLGNIWCFGKRSSQPEVRLYLMYKKGGCIIGVYVQEAFHPRIISNLHTILFSCLITLPLLLEHFYFVTSV